MTDILTNPNLDPKIRESIVPGCWVQWSCRCEKGKWLLVTDVDAKNITTTAGWCYLREVVALHEPCREPRMETAYVFGLPGTVTRAEAAKMVTVMPELKSDLQRMWFEWESGCDEVGEIGWVGVLNKTQLNETSAIRSPGDNVWKVED